MSLFVSNDPTEHCPGLPESRKTAGNVAKESNVSRGPGKGGIKIKKGVVPAPTPFGNSPLGK